MGCLPYFKFYPDDWLSDRKVRRLGPVSRALYLELLADAWKEGGIPADRSELEEFALWRGFTRSQFTKAWEQVEQFWVHGADGVLVNPRQEDERTKAMAVYEQRVAAGRKGGRPKANGKPS